MEELVLDILNGEKTNFDLEAFIELSYQEKNISEKELKSKLIKIINNKIRFCNNCHLKTMDHVTQSVPPIGNVDSPIILVGEGPGVEEDNKGQPFVGKAGLLLDRILTSFDLTRNQLYITNLIKCRPPNNRNPAREEINKCHIFLDSELKVVKPKVIIALGSVAFNYFTNGGSIQKNRGIWFRLNNGIWLMPTYHPAYLLRLEGSNIEKRVKWNTWYDFNNAFMKAKELCPDFTFKGKGN